MTDASVNTCWSWCLYFWKRVFSFRADSILKSDGDFISNWKFPDCVHFFGTWDRQAVIETIAVVYEHTKRTQEMCSPIGHNSTKHFLCPIRSWASAWIFWNGPVRVGTQGLFRPYLKTFVAHFLPTRLTAPGSPRMRSSTTHFSLNTFVPGNYLRKETPLKRIKFVLKNSSF